MDTEELAERAELFHKLFPDGRVTYEAACKWDGPPRALIVMFVEEGGGKDGGEMPEGAHGQGKEQSYLDGSAARAVYCGGLTAPYTQEMIQAYKNALRDSRSPLFDSAEYKYHHAKMKAFVEMFNQGEPR